ncbi:MAG: M14 family zinc carboxypeptidase [Verrucomicrobiota bacterium]
MPSDHPKRGWQCWWYFRLEGLSKGETLTLDVGNSPWATPDQATVSMDDQKTWQHTEKGKREGKRITYRYTAKKDGLHWFAWGPPFVLKDANSLIQEASKKGGNWATPFILAKSRDGHEVPSIRISETKKPTIGIWIQARQHAWESGSSWVCKGFLEWLVSSEAEELRKHAEIVITPIIDVDNVELGAGGKSQEPWDHNRDWRKKPHWSAVAAAQKEIAALHKDGRFHLFIDLHNPGANDQESYFYTSPRDILSPEAIRNLDLFNAATQKFITNPIPFSGKLIESGPKYDPENWSYISKNWVSKLTHNSAVVAVTLETAWNTPGSHADGYRAAGRQLGLAIENYVSALVEPSEDGK